MDAQSRYTIHLVDDSAAIRDRLKELLAACPNATVTGESGTVAEAVTRIRAARPDFVVLDYKLPDGHGLDVIRLLGPVAHGCRFIALTNHPSPHLRQAFADAGVHHFLDKSHEFERLPAIIAGLCSSP